MPRVRSEASEKVINCMVARLESAFDLNLVSYADYPEVKKLLGWKESTFRNVLAYLGKDTGDLICVRRTYNPTPDETRVLMRYVSTSMMVTLAITGCRLSELWLMRIVDGRTLVSVTKKGGVTTTLDLTHLGVWTRNQIIHWVKVESKVLSQGAAVKRWQRARETYGLDERCVPHAYRHNVASLLKRMGYDADVIQRHLGHRKIESTYNYIHDAIDWNGLENSLFNREGGA